MHVRSAPKERRRCPRPVGVKARREVSGGRRWGSGEIPFCHPSARPFWRRSALATQILLAPAQRRGHSRTNPPSTWCKRSAKASASGCEAPVATAGLLGWCARIGTCMLAAASPTHRHVTGVHQQRCADAPRHPEAAHSTHTGHVGRVERQLGASGGLRARSSARRRTARRTACRGSRSS